MWNTLFHYEARKVKELQRSAWDVDQILYGSRLAAMFTERRGFHRQPDPDHFHLSRRGTFDLNKQSEWFRQAMQILFINAEWHISVVHFFALK